MSDAERTIAAIFRIDLPKLIEGLARMVRDVGRAEELFSNHLSSWGHRWHPYLPRG